MNYEKLLDGFEPDFEFIPVNPLPEAEYEERKRRIRREMTQEELDALVVLTERVIRYHPSNAYIQYVCDWRREGVLILPTDEDKPSTLLSIFGTSILLPPPGEPVGIEDIRSVGVWGRKETDRPGNSIVKVAKSTKEVLDELKINDGTVGFVGDWNPSTFFGRILTKMLQQMNAKDANHIINNMQLVRSKNEQKLMRASAQIGDIGFQAATHVCKPGVTDYEIYAALTFAMMARGVESGDSYQIGINRYGTHTGKPYGHVVKPGDIVNIYLSHIEYQGINTQSARMIIVGDIPRYIEDVIEMCVESTNEGMKAAGPGVPICDINDASFQPFIARGKIQSSCGRTMPHTWEPNPDGTARRIPIEYVKDEDWESMGRVLRHVYPPFYGPNAPRIGHSTGYFGIPSSPVVIQNETIPCQPGMAFIIHAQWSEPNKAGCNIGNYILITETGIENLTNHSPLEPVRVKI